MKKQKYLVNVLVVLIVLGAATLVFSKSKNTAKDKVYRKKGLITNVPGPNNYAKGEPGETAVRDRAYFIAPPLIPHNIKDFSISRSGNDCMGCHIEGMEVSEGHIATRIPLSHFENLYTKKKTKDRVTGTRYNCVQCHVPQTGDTPPVSQMK